MSDKTAAPDRRDPRPRSFPPPEFPPRRPARFARLPPAIFPPILGLLGLALSLRMAAGLTALPALAALADLMAGLTLALWLFAVAGLKIKILRRPAVLGEEFRPLPGRAGLAAATMGGMAAGALMVPFLPTLAYWLILAALFSHVILLALLIRTIVQMPPDAREVNPVWHMSTVGVIVAATPLAALGHDALARAILWVALGLALVIWALSLVQILRRIPPAPLRPLLAIHLAPAALLSLAAGALGLPLLAQVLLALALMLFAALAFSARWVTSAGFSPLWGAFTFPSAALSLAMMAAGGTIGSLGLGLVAINLLALPMIAWRILSLWPTGQLAARTNAAEA